MEIIEISIGNYRGNLQIANNDNKYYWRVNCDVHDEGWIEISKSLYNELIARNIVEENENDNALYRVSLNMPHDKFDT